MALHGTIMVNDHVIGAWSARRLRHPPGKVNDYSVSYAVTETDGSQTSGMTTLTHVFDDGALVLAAKVLAFAAEDRKRSRGDG